MSSQGSLHWGIARCGKYPLWNCPLGKCQSEICLCVGKCQSGNCPDTNLSVKLSQRAASKSSMKREMTSSSHRKPCAKQLLTDLQFLKELSKMLLNIIRVTYSKYRF